MRKLPRTPPGTPRETRRAIASGVCATLEFIFAPQCTSVVSGGESYRRGPTPSPSARVPAIAVAYASSSGETAGRVCEPTPPAHAAAPRWRRANTRRRSRRRRAAGVRRPGQLAAGGRVRPASASAAGLPRQSRQRHARAAPRIVHQAGSHARSATYIGTSSSSPPSLDILHLLSVSNRTYLALAGLIQASTLGLDEPGTASRGGLGGL